MSFSDIHHKWYLWILLIPGHRSHICISETEKDFSKWPVLLLFPALDLSSEMYLEAKNTYKASKDHSVPQCQWEHFFFLCSIILSGIQRVSTNADSWFRNSMPTVEDPCLGEFSFYTSLYLLGHCPETSNVSFSPQFCFPLKISKFLKWSLQSFVCWSHAFWSEERQRVWNIVKQNKGKTKSQTEVIWRTRQEKRKAYSLVLPFSARVPGLQIM